MRVKSWIMLTMTLVKLAGVGFAVHKLVPDASIIDFKLPMFGESGYRVWDLRGKEGLFLSEGEVEVQGMLLRTFSGDEKNKLEATIESIKAIIKIQENQAYGDELIVLKGPGYSLVGNGWSWDGKAKKVIVNENVRVTFDEVLEKGLM